LELWIRSQDKTILSKAHDLIIRENRNGDNTINYAIQDIYTMGIYSTQERALEVLDEIQKKLQPSLYIYEPKEYDKPKTITDATPSLRIYEMPKE
jgi:hypothetical protein